MSALSAYGPFTLMKVNKSISGVPLHDCLVYVHNEVSVVFDKLLIFNDEIFKVFLKMALFLVNNFRNLCCKLKFRNLFESFSVIQMSDFV